MQRFCGTPLSVGIATGPVFYLRTNGATPAETTAADVPLELSRLDQAFEDANAQYTNMLAQSDMSPERDATALQILKSQQVLLSDPLLREAIEQKIKGQTLSSEFALTLAVRELSAQLKQNGTPYLSARTEDLSDVAAALLSVLGQELPSKEPEMPYLLLAENLSPAALLRLSREKLLGIVTKETALHSHTAILARTFGVPALTGIPVDPSWDGQIGLLDSDAREFVLAPGDKLLSSARDKTAARTREQTALLAYQNAPTVTRSGRRVPIYANISSPADLPAVRNCGAEGIGLFRSEFLFLGRDTLPDEDEQCASYREALSALRDKEVVIRTFDLGGEKSLSLFPQNQIEHLTSTLRGIRFALSHPELFKTQLRALLRASTAGTLSILFPMISTPAELQEATALLNEVRRELTERDIPIVEIKVGTMIETPAAVELAPELAALSDFLCIGTNDLTQYTYGIDRMAPALPETVLSDPKAIFRQIARVTDAAHREKKEVRICGELAANTDLTSKFLSLGIDGFSVSPYAILPLRKEVNHAP